MIKYILLFLILLYCLFVASKMVKNLKNGKCMGCSGGECNCNCNKEDNKF